MEESVKEFDNNNNTANPDERSKESEDRKKTLKHITVSRLFERASDLCGVDAQYGNDIPLCKECAQKHLKNLDLQMSEAIKENSSYKSFLEQLEAEKNNSLSEEQLDQEIKKVCSNPSFVPSLT